MKRYDEMNELEREGANVIMKRLGFNHCVIGGSKSGWSCNKITIEKKYVYFDRELYTCQSSKGDNNE